MTDHFGKPRHTCRALHSWRRFSPAFRAHRLAHQRADKFLAVDGALGGKPVDPGEHGIVHGNVELSHGQPSASIGTEMAEIRQSRRSLEFLRQYPSLDLPIPYFCQAFWPKHSGQNRTKTQAILRVSPPIPMATR